MLIGGDLVVICPTLWRRANAERLVESWAATPRAADTHLALIADRVDRSYEGMRLPAGVRIWYPLGFGWLTEKTNIVARAFAGTHTAVMSTGDDSIFTDPGWDGKLLEPLEAAPGVSWPVEERPHPNPGSFVVSSEIVDALGWLMLPDLHHHWADHATWQLANDAGCGHPTDARLPQLHYQQRPDIPYDATYQRGESMARQDADAYQAWKNSPRYAEAVAKVRGAVAAGHRPRSGSIHQGAGEPWETKGSGARGPG